jgi:hypothetical protein
MSSIHHITFYFLDFFSPILYSKSLALHVFHLTGPAITRSRSHPFIHIYSIYHRADKKRLNLTYFNFNLVQVNNLIFKLKFVYFYFYFF